MSDSAHRLRPPPVSPGCCEVAPVEDSLPPVATLGAECTSDRDRVRSPTEEDHRLIGPLLERCRAAGGTDFEGTHLPQCSLEGKTYVATWNGGNLKKGFLDLMKWKTKCGAPSYPTAAEAASKCPSVDSVDRAAIASPPAGGAIQSTWMGHASFLVQVNGINILTDPVWSDRASPVQFTGPKRFVKPPISLDSLPCHIHVVTISHNHYDHLDTPTVRKLHKLFDPVWIVPFGMKRDWFCSEFSGAEKKASLDKVHELHWWQCLSLTIPIGSPAGRGEADESSSSNNTPQGGAVNPTDPFASIYSESARADRSTSPSTASSRELHVTAVPVQHWSMRKGGWDRNTQLWCGFVYEVPLPPSISLGKGEEVDSNLPSPREQSPVTQRIVRRMFHSGDTGYCTVFKDVGNVFKHFDLAMIPIGAYHPRWMLSVQHVDPEEAVLMHEDLHRPTLSLGMHWGTFILTDEPIDEPPKLLAASLAAHNLPTLEFRALKHGETVTVLDGAHVL